MRKISAALLFGAIGCIASGQEQSHEHGSTTPHPPKPAAAAKSRTVQGANWKVTVLAAERYTTARPNIDPEVSTPGMANLRLDMQFEYLGPTGKVPPPAAVARLGDRKLKTIGNILIHSAPGVEDDYSIVAWLLSAENREPILRPVRTGQKFGTYSFYVADIPLGRASVLLKVADTPQFKLDFKGQP